MQHSNYTHLLAAGAIALFALTACSAGTGAPAEADTSAESPQAEAPTEPDATPLSADALEKIFTENQFDPTAFASGEAMFASIYPGISAAPACLTALGITPLSDTANTVFGPSIDRTLTAQVSSFASGADEAFESLSNSADECASDPQVTYQGQPLDVTVERTGDKPTAFQTSLTGTMQGQPVSVRGYTVLVEQNIITMAGWDPGTNEQNVPLATAYFTEKLREAIDQAG